MAAVRHDNVATIFEVGESDGTPFMAMEMLKGGTLEAFNKDKHRLGYEKIIDYAKQIAHGLAAAPCQRNRSSRYQASQHLDRGGDRADQDLGFWIGIGVDSGRSFGRSRRGDRDPWLSVARTSPQRTAG